MGSVMTELLHEPAQPWHHSNMNDARSHHTEQNTRDSSYRPSPTSTPRPSGDGSSTSVNDHSTPHTQSTLAQRQASSHARTPSSSSRASAPREQPTGPASPALAPTEPGNAPATQRHQPAMSSSSQHIPPTFVPRPITSPSNSPPKINVQSLQHIQNIADSDPALLSPNLSDMDDDAAPQYIISDMPVGDIIEMVAGLLTKITTTNDEHYEHLHRSIPAPDSAGGLSPQTSSVLAFHGKNVPSITILSYLGRIQKYCPATYEVFLSLLVYFDRMTERVNSGQMQSLRQANQESVQRQRARHERGSLDSAMDVDKRAASLTPPASETRSPKSQRQRPSANLPTVQEPPSPPLSDSDPTNLSHFFVVDSFNIHRLVIAGVTCAAKFFSDVFFTNSRYAKVGGLPLVELNHLELQFLLLNDFRLAITVEELDQYATMLVEFYAREVAAQRQNEAMDGVDGAEAIGVDMVSR